MEFCIQTFNDHLKPSYVQFYKNLELQNNFNRIFVTNELILPRICCAHRQLARCFISTTNYKKCTKDEDRNLNLLKIGELNYCNEINSKISMSNCRNILSLKIGKSSSASINLSSFFNLLSLAIILFILFNN